MPDFTGRKISRYQILDELGRGGMGVVYRAIDPRDGRRVVVKILTPDAAADAEWRARFEREARACAALHHPGITEIYETGEADGIPFICMEYVEGRTLRAVLGDGPLEPREAAGIVAEVADAIAAAHSRGIIHRDLKPENIMVGPEGRPKVLDFGIAAIVDPPQGDGDLGVLPTNAQRLTTVGALLGTVNYMSPEQAAGRPAGPASDVFALGAVLYEMIAGLRPFLGENDMAILHAIAYDNPPPLAARRADTPHAIEAVVRRALRKDPGTRHANAAALRDDLRLALGGGARSVAEDSTAPHMAITAKHTGRIPSRLEPSAEPGAESPLFGRGSQIRRIEAALHEAREGRGQVLLVRGEAGIGKTRLLAECGRRFDARGGLYVVGRCLFREGGLPYHPFVEAAERLISLLGVDTAEELRDHVKERMPALVGRLPILLSFLHLPGGSQGLAAEPINRDHLLDAIAAFFVQAARVKPILIHIDDLHWADEGTLDLFQYIGRGLRGSCGAIAGTYRPEESRALLSRLSAGDVFVEIALDRLDAAGTEQIVRGALPGAEPSAEFLAPLHRDTAGNPFFVLEAIRLLKADGLIRRQEESWVIDPRAAGQALPGRIHEVVGRRLSRLSPAERQILEIAACEGMSFRSATLAACLSRDRYEVLASLQALERDHRLIRHEDESYRFDHPMIREALYEEIIPELRREHHRRIAEYLVGADPVSPLRADAAAVAFHLLEAREEERAIPYLLQSAEMARTLFANSDAARALDRTLAILDAREAAGAPSGAGTPLAAWRIKAHKDRGKLFVRLGEFERAKADFLEMRARSRGARVASREAHAENLLADLAVRTGDYGGAMDHARRAYEIAQASGDRHSLASALAVTGIVHFNHGRFDEALAAHSRSITLQQSIEDLGGYSDNLNKIGNIHLRQGHTEEALAVYGTALALARQAGQRLFEAEALNNIGAVHHERGALEEALKEYEESLALKREIGDRRAIARSLNNLGLLREIRGEFSAAMAAHQESLALKRDLGDQAGIASSLSNLGSLLEKMGEYAAALASCEESLAIKKALGESWSIPYCQNSLGRLRLALNDIDGAEALFSDALRGTRELGDRPEECRSITNLAEAMLASGRCEGALSVLRDAASLAEQLGLREMLVEIHYLAGLAALESGDAAEAAAALSRLGDVRAGTHFAHGGVLAKHLDAMVARARTGEETAAPAFDAAIAAARDVGLRGLEWRILDDAGRVDDAREALLTLAEGVPAGDLRRLFLSSARARALTAPGAAAGDIPSA
ncbi:MAG: tetratricopeptide repeat protein [Acidobacteria bacterium]|nr:tetratricopeptide repeat protein [Acidobacteriota bacterium]